MVSIVGLGNPGDEYVNTRHNLGFDVADRVAQEAGMRFKEGKGDYLVAFGSFKNRDIVVAKPLTYMNNSGEAVADIIERYAISLDQLLVVCDDFQLPLGTLRLRHGGSDGGHNGLASIIYQLQTEEFPRLRCGIGGETTPKDKSFMKDFVLDQFSNVDLPLVNTMRDKAKEACKSFVEHGVDKTMTVYNRFNE